MADDGDEREGKEMYPSCMHAYEEGIKVLTSTSLAHDNPKSSISCKQ